MLPVPEVGETPVAESGDEDEDGDEDGDEDEDDDVRGIRDLHEEVPQGTPEAQDRLQSRALEQAH